MVGLWDQLGALVIQSGCFLNESGAFNVNLVRCWSGVLLVTRSVVMKVILSSPAYLKKMFIDLI